MKVLSLFISFYAFLLAGTSPADAVHVHVNGNHAIQHFEKHGHGKATHADQGFTLIDDTDLDVNEEINVGDKIKDRSADKLCARKYSLPQDWTVSHSQQLLSNNLNRDFNTFPPLCRHTPIYITQRVLRI